MRRPWSVAALAALILAVPIGAVAASDASRTTSLHVYLVFRPDGRLASNLEVVTRTSGTCSGPSHISVRVDAWRCGPAQGFYDPCFSSRGRATGPVVCPLAPWSSRVVLMRLSKSLPVLSGNPRGNPLRSGPWAMVTMAGKRCRLIASGTIDVAGMRDRSVDRQRLVVVTQARRFPQTLLGAPSCPTRSPTTRRSSARRCSSRSVRRNGSRSAARIGAARRARVPRA